MSVDVKETVKRIYEEVKAKSLEDGDMLINALHAIQDHFNNFIPPEAAEELSELMNLPPSKIYEVLTFYTMFSTKPRGKYVIRVCQSTPCHVTGGREVIEALKETLGIDFGETTEDGLFTLEYSSCLGLCGVAPVMMINDMAYGNLTPERVKAIIEELKGGEKR
ncbi:MAG: NADH-quinone oxidoreductase subunit NuoE [Thermotogae bacterium]|nr:NADH-quinone oxidoreductase subunit NuoE [Thermotogota bacterium]